MSACENQDSTQDALVTATKADVVDLRHDIPTDIDIYIKNLYGVDDSSSISQGQFNVAMMDIRDRYISNMDFLTHDGLEYKYKSDGVLKELCDIYIRLCQQFKKHVCSYGFECLTGVSSDTLERWYHDKKASREKAEIAKKILHLDEETLADFLTDGKRNPVGVLAVLNNRHGWSSQRVTHETEQPRLDNTEIRGLLGVKS